MLRVRFFFPLLFGLAALAAACGGGGGGGGSVIPSGTPTPHAGPTTIPVGPSPDVINLSGDGYNLEFAVPPVTTGTIATMSATLQTALPSGTVAPSSKHRAAAPRRIVAPNIGANVKGLVYLVVSTTATVGFSSAPSFQFTMPAGTTIPSGQSSYLLFWDPNAAGSTGWVALLGPGTVSGQVVTFPGVNTGVNLEANTQYVYALAVTTAPVPTATPAPTPTPTPVPSPTSTPLSAYCSTINYSAVAGGIPVNITDDSGTGAVLIVYIENKAGWLAANGTWVGSPNPLPAACFSTTKHSSGTVPLLIPSGIKGGRVYFALATPVPSPNTNTVIPNPFGDAKAPISGPNVGYQGAAPFPWDKIEYGTVISSNPVIDTTQVDALGLPLELSISANGTPMPDSTQAPAGSCAANSVTAGSAGPYGVTSCKFDAIFQAVYNNQQYRPLVYTAQFMNKQYDMQVVSPSQALLTSFDWNLFADPATMPSTIPSPCPTPAQYGYLSCVLAAYQSTPRVFTNMVSGSGTTTQTYYCVTADTQNFKFTNNGSSASCPNPLPAAAITLPVNLFMFANVPDPSPPPSWVCDENITFGQPFGLAYVDGAANNPSQPSGNLFASNDSFAMWKALTADLNYGEALSTSVHPIGQVSPPPITANQLFTDPMYNVYDKVMHDNFNGGLAYGIPYDDLYNLESGVSLTSSSDSINVRINPLPTSNPSIPVTPLASPPAMPLPTACPSIGPGI